MLYAFFCVIPRRLNFICRRFGTLCLFHLHRQAGSYPRMKMGQSVPKRRHIKFRRRGITQKKTYNSFIPFACAECDVSLPFTGASSIPVMYFSCHPSPPTILPSSLTSSCHLYLGLPLNLVVPTFMCCFINTQLINQLCSTYITLKLLLHTQRGCLSLRFVPVSLHDFRESPVAVS